MGSGLSTDTANKEWDELTKEEQIKILESGYVTSYESVAEEDGQWVDFDDNHRVRQPTISDIPDIAKSMFQGYSQKLKKKFGDEDIDGHTPEEMIKREHELMGEQPKEEEKKIHQQLEKEFGDEESTVSVSGPPAGTQPPANIWDDLDKAEEDFVEQEHPREQTGKFTTKGGGSSKAGQPKEKSKKEFTLKDYERNEGRNAHTLNALNLVKKYGTPEEIKEMEEIKDRHDKSEHGINHDDYKRRHEISNKYYDKLVEDETKSNESNANEFEPERQGRKVKINKGTYAGQTGRVGAIPLIDDSSFFVRVDGVHNEYEDGIQVNVNDVTFLGGEVKYDLYEKVEEVKIPNQDIELHKYAWKSERDYAPYDSESHVKSDIKGWLDKTFPTEYEEPQKGLDSETKADEDWYDTDDSNYKPEVLKYKIVTSLGNDWGLQTNSKAEAQRAVDEWNNDYEKSVSGSLPYTLKIVDNESVDDPKDIKLLDRLLDNELEEEKEGEDDYHDTYDESYKKKATELDSIYKQFTGQINAPTGKGIMDSVRGYSEPEADGQDLTGTTANEEIIEKTPPKINYQYYKQYPFGRIQKGFFGEVDRKWWETASYEEKAKELSDIGFGMGADIGEKGNPLARRSWDDLPNEARQQWGYFGNEVELSTMYQARDWWDKKYPDRLWKDMHIDGRQRAIMAFLRDPDTELKSEEGGQGSGRKPYASKDPARKDRAHVGWKNQGIDKYTDLAMKDYLTGKKSTPEEYEYAGYHASKEVEDQKCEGCGREEDYLNDDNLCEDCEREAGIDREESKRDAYEGGKGSGKKGHQQWMRSLEEDPSYGECKNCKVITEKVNNKCQMCGRKY